MCLADALSSLTTLTLLILPDSFQSSGFRFSTFGFPIRSGTIFSLDDYESILVSTYSHRIKQYPGLQVYTLTVTLLLIWKAVSKQ